MHALVKLDKNQIAPIQDDNGSTSLRSSMLLKDDADEDDPDIEVDNQFCDSSAGDDEAVINEQQDSETQYCSPMICEDDLDDMDDLDADIDELEPADEDSELPVVSACNSYNDLLVTIMCIEKVMG